MLTIEDVTPSDILELCKTKAFANIAMGIALGYTPQMCATFVLANHDSKYGIPDEEMGEYLNCGFHPSRDDLKVPLKQTIDLINHRRWFEQPFHQFDTPNMTNTKLDKYKHWADLKSFMEFHQYRVDFIQAVLLVLYTAVSALENNHSD